MSLMARRGSVTPYRNQGGSQATALVSATVSAGAASGESTFGVHLPVFRTYTSGTVPVSFAACPASADWDSVNLVPFRTSVWSCKPDLAQQAAGTLDSNWTTFLNSIPNGHSICITIWHEPDAKVRTGTFTLADWQAAWDEWTAFMVTYKAANPAKLIQTYLCITSGPWTYSKTTNPDDYYRGTFDIWAPDCYMNVSYAYENTIANAIDAPIQYGIGKGSTIWGMPEWATNYDMTQTDYQANMINAVGAYIDKTPGCAWVMYFSEGTTQPNAHDATPWPESKAALANSIATHQG